MWSRPQTHRLYNGAILTGEASATPSELEALPILSPANIHDYPAPAANNLVRVFDFISTYPADRKEHEPLRRLGDPLADDLVEYLDLKPGQDAFAAIQAELKSDVVDERVSKFWEAVNREPIPGVSGRSSYGIAINDNSELVAPTTLARERELILRGPCVALGQSFIGKYGSLVWPCLLHGSLAAGFSAPKLQAVMKTTSYLTGNSEATYKRLLETMIWTIDAMTDMRVGVGKGWISTVRVRLLHAMVRLRVKKRAKYDYQENGIPINQSDLISVLGSFMVMPILSMRRLGVYPSDFELQSYLVAWRHIGFYLGIEEDLLIKFYGKTFAHAETSVLSLFFELLPPTSGPEGQKQTYNILAAVANRAPQYTGVGYHVEYCRAVLGDSLADYHGLPRSSLADKLTVKRHIAICKFCIAFGSYYRDLWEERRRALLKETFMLLAMYGLGKKRAIFAWRAKERHAEKYAADEGEDPGVEMSSSVGNRIKKGFMLQFAELGLVVSCVPVTIMGCVYYFRRRY